MFLLHRFVQKLTCRTTKIAEDVNCIKEALLMMWCCLYAQEKVHLLLFKLMLILLLILKPIDEFHNKNISPSNLIC